MSKATPNPIPPNNIRVLLKQMDMRQCHLNRMKGKSPDYISGIVNSYRRPSVATVEVIAAVLDCKISEVFPHFNIIGN